MITNAEMVFVACGRVHVLILLHRAQSSFPKTNASPAQ